MSFDTALYLALFAGAFLLMMRCGCRSHVFGRSHRHGVHADADAVPAPMARSGVEPLADGRTTDPVCGKPVEKATALSAVHDGATYYFCSQRCREKFTAAPASYPVTSAAGAKPARHHHGCC